MLSLAVLSLAMFVSCQKDVLPTPDAITMQGSETVTNYTDMTSSGFDKNNHPFFKALDNHEYYFELRCGVTGNPGSYPLGASVQLNFENAPNGHVGNIILGQKTFVPGTSNDYGIVVGEPITDPTFTGNFGQSTYFKFSGDGPINSFDGNLRFPKIMTITSVSNFVEAQSISRKNYSVRFDHDKPLDLPVLLQISWSTAGDPANANHTFKSVTNLFLIDDNGSVTLTESMFKDMPKQAQGVFVSLWRGNAAQSSQDLYFIAASAKSFSVNLTD